MNEKRGDLLVNDLVRNTTVVLQNVVVDKTFSCGNLLGSKKDLRGVFVRQLVQLHGMVCSGISLKRVLISGGALEAYTWG